jgi:hypothetical protein
MSNTMSENTEAFALFDNAISWLDDEIKRLTMVKEMAKNIIEKYGNNYLSEICGIIYHHKAVVEILRSMKADIEYNGLEIEKCYQHIMATCGSMMVNEVAFVWIDLLNFLSKKHYEARCSRA